MNACTHLIEESCPTEDSKVFRRCLGQFATGVTVMTARHGERMAGMSVNSFSALSLDPPLVMWSIRRESASLDVFRDAGFFAVNILAAEQIGVSGIFASPKEDKFGNSQWELGQYGAPLLTGSIAHFECSLDRMLDGGDHMILTGRVERCARFMGEPLLFTQGRYAVSHPHPALVDGDTHETLDVGRSLSDATEGSHLRLLHYTSKQMSRAFEAHRRAEGISAAELRIYGWLRTKARSLEHVAQIADLRRQEAQDAVTVMMSHGHLVQNALGELCLAPAGRERADALWRRACAFEAEILHDLSDADIESTRRVLGALATRSRASPQ